jgi:hypothetical protein
MIALLCNVNTSNNKLWLYPEDNNINKSRAFFVFGEFNRHYSESIHGIELQARERSKSWKLFENNSGEYSRNHSMLISILLDRSFPTYFNHTVCFVLARNVLCENGVRSVSRTIHCEVWVSIHGAAETEILQRPAWPQCRRWEPGYKLVYF